YSRARQMFSFHELAGTDMTLLLDESIMIRVFQMLELHYLFVAKRVCSRWKPICENTSCYSDLDMQAFIHNSRYLPHHVLQAFILGLSMDVDEIDALKMVCREIPRLPQSLATPWVNGGDDSISSSSVYNSSSNNSSPPSAGGRPVSAHIRVPSYGGAEDTESTLSLSTSSLSSSYDSPPMLGSSNSSTPTLSSKEALKRQKLRKERERRMEDAMKVWSDDIIPNWTSKSKSLKKVREMIYQGIPSVSREKAWPLLIGNDLNITPELYSIFRLRAERAKHKGDLSLGREGTVTLIHLDLPRTFPKLSIFQDEGPYHEKLAAVLEAYVCYRPDVGYVQGMSYIAAIFLLILDDYEAFVCLSNLLNNPCFMSFYTMNLEQMEVYMRAMDSLIATNLPKIHRHMRELGIQPDVFMIDWVLTIFSKALPLDVATHVWDYLFLEKEIFIFQVALGILKMYSRELETGDFDLCMTLLTHLPSDIDDDELFQHISSFNITQKQFAKLVGTDK
ncbi:hypothetical protein SAMD00019534_120030, partial [Acytostelium subglobosum LB1]|uniref:hypothetical protein n=1 Tax=Acytostelium subglobosum LB1 TaxID=1410327 RepID=UPI0006450FAC